MRILAVVVALSAMLYGCAQRERLHFAPGKGKAGQFILKQAIKYGGSPAAVDRVPRIPGPWVYAEDRYGTVIRFPVSSYEPLKELLQLSFGTPFLGPSPVSGGGVLGVYRLTPSGGGIQFGFDDEGTQVIILRPPTAAKKGAVTEKSPRIDV